MLPEVASKSVAAGVTTEDAAVTTEAAGVTKEDEDILAEDEAAAATGLVGAATATEVAIIRRPEDGAAAATGAVWRGELSGVKKSIEATGEVLGDGGAAASGTVTEGTVISIGTLRWIGDTDVETVSEMKSNSRHLGQGT